MNMFTNIDRKSPRVFQSRFLRRSAMATLEKASHGRMTEEEIRAKYPHVVKGSLRFDSKAKKSKITLRCPVKGCGRTRRCYTSDLFQIKQCGEHLANDLGRRRARLTKAALAQ
jgi:hypothetical protein